MALRIKLLSFTSKDKSASLLEFNIAPEKPANAVSRRIGFVSPMIAPHRRPQPRFSAFSIFELFSSREEG